MEYWLWILLGILLILSELAIPTFFILWFGVAAILVGGLEWALNLPLYAQLLLWAVFSVAMAVAWFKYLKPHEAKKAVARLSREAVIGQVGHIIAAPTAGTRGRMRFAVPLLGADEWAIIATDSDLQLGDRVQVTDILGNALQVAKLQPGPAPE
ncbi:MAG: NfeD family protein [Cellvibrionales bacterium]|nr:NfeD family protein [Cellvibrionales bacterium]